MSAMIRQADNPIALSDSSLPVEALIAKAIEHGISVEGLERLLAMRERLKAEAAREAFFAALSAFQAECPVVPKRKVARVESKSGASYSYRYAPLDDIVEAVTPLLAKHGLSHTEQARFEDGPQPAQVVACIVHHIAGHSEASEFRAPIDSGARMNVIQQNGAALTYAKRYAFCNALGILTGDDDDDGRSNDVPVSSRRSPDAPRPASNPEPAANEMEELRQLNEQLGDRKWGPALLKGKVTGRPNGYAVTKAELEALLAGAKPPTGERRDA